MKLNFREVFTAEEEYDRVFGECLKLGCTLEQAQEQIDHLKSCRTYRDDDNTYQVVVEEIGDPFGGGADMVWLSIKRVDQEALHDWRILQAIKNGVLGEENEAFEIYPAESRLVDTSNQYHLFGFKDPKVRLPVGFTQRGVMGPTGIGRSKQRPFEEVA